MLISGEFAYQNHSKNIISVRSMQSHFVGTHIHQAARNSPTGKPSCREDSSLAERSSPCEMNSQSGKNLTVFLSV